MKKPQGRNVFLLDLDKCLQFAVQKSVMTNKTADFMVEYAKDLGIEAGYWDLHWGDIVERNGMDEGQAKEFEAFYRLFKIHEVKEKRFPHLHFDVAVYT